MTLIDEAIDSGARKWKACETMNIPVRTLERWVRDPVEDKRKTVKNIPSNKLTDSEIEEIKSISCSDRFKDLSPNEIVPILAENGVYIASERTFYRVLKAEELLAHRSENDPPKKRYKPDEYTATGPDQVWSWDITYLLTEIKGRYYYLYMVEDIWSRAIRGWEIYEKESAEYASELIKKICMENNISNVVLHSDNGSPMKGATMLATLQRLGVVPSFSRPSVSNDNPYSESLFKTVKYIPGYPKTFASVDEARKWMKKFVDWYNNEHRHSGIKFVTPMQRHTGKDTDLLKIRKETYEKAKQKNPERWSNNTRNWDRIEEVKLNPDSLQGSQHGVLENAA
jgi:transposase InsO family protein